LHHPINPVEVPTVPAADLGTQRHCNQHFLLNLLARTARQMDTGNMVKTEILFLFFIRQQAP
jgi:hypothetical protein